MSRQNRLNAGAEFVLCRIWATLLDRSGADVDAGHRNAGDPAAIHAESLLACLGALAGYSCQAYARRAALRGGSERRKYAFTTVTARDGTRLFESDALNPQLAGGPLSIWALVSRTVQKLGEPVPEVDGIFRHVAETVGTSAFGLPRAPAGHHPRRAPIVYLKQLWPQILPIAQPFCRKPAQLPVLFGIALQRAIEHTQSLLKPSLGASLAMECAVAMSKVILPEAATADAHALAAIHPNAERAPASVSWMPASAQSSALASERRNRTPTKDRGEADARVFHVGLLAERLAPARNILTIMSFAIVAMAGTMWSTDRDEVPQVAREAPSYQSPVLPPANLPTIEEEPVLDTPPIDEMQVVVARNEPAPEEIDPPTPVPEQPANEGIIAEDGQGSFESNAGGEMSAAAMTIES